jgi:hypothetical protein
MELQAELGRVKEQNRDLALKLLRTTEAHISPPPVALASSLAAPAPADPPPQGPATTASGSGAILSWFGL